MHKALKVFPKTSKTNYTILYAHDTVLPKNCSQELNYFYEYCEKWNLKVNTRKSKVMFFSKGRLPINLNFKMDNMELKIVSEFIYYNVSKNRIFQEKLI